MSHMLRGKKNKRSVKVRASDEEAESSINLYNSLFELKRQYMFYASISLNSIYSMI